MRSLFARLKVSKEASGRRRSPVPEAEQRPAAAVDALESEPIQTPTVEQSSLPALQIRLWNGAYDALKQSEPKLVDAFERILTARLGEIQGSDAQPLSANEISERPEKRCEQMRTVIQNGLDRSEKAAALAEKADQGLQIFASVKGIVTAALQSVPQAAVPWACVCMGLEALSAPIKQYTSHRTGLKYVLLRMDWYWNLALLLLSENMIDETSKSFAAEMEKSVITLYQKLLEYQMKSVCVHHRNGLATFGINALKLDDWDGKLKSIKEEELQLNGNAMQYNSELVKSRLQHVLDSAHGQEMKLSGIQEAIQDGNRKEEHRYTSEKDNQCLRELCVTDPRADKKEIEERKGGLLKGSYLWITQHDDFKRFLADSSLRLLWIDGGAGKGKTMLMCGIIDQLASSNQMLSYFFCQQTDMDLNTATNILRGLIFTLVKQQPELLPYLRAKHEEQGEKLFQGRTAWVSLKDVFIEMITSHEIASTTILVDALDECATGRAEFLDFLLFCIKLDDSPIKWIVSSREKWIDIEEKINTAEQKVRLQLHLNQDLVSDAIRFFIRHKVDGLSRLKQYTTEIETEVETFLQNNANGTFLWVALVCQALSQVPRRRASATLQSFPPGLEALYRRMLHVVERSDEASLCKEVLATVCIVKRPLTSLELKALVPLLQDFEIVEVGEIIGQCGSFLTIQGSLVQFIHQSAKDFLLDDASAEIFPTGVTQHHRQIFRWSVEALTRVLRRDVYELQRPGYLISKIVPPNPDPLAPIRYCCVNWTDHLQEALAVCGQDMAEGGFLDDFLRHKILYLFEALSLLKGLGSGVRSLLRLETFIPSTSPNLRHLVQDANRFIGSFKIPIEMAPLQAYASALMFSPQNSVVRQLFFNDRFQDMSLDQPPTLEWGPLIHVLEHRNNIVSLAYIQGNSQRLITQAYRPGGVEIELWDIMVGDRIRGTEIPETNIFSYNSIVTSDGKIALVQISGGDVELWNLENASRLNVFEGSGKARLHSAIFPSHTGKVMMAFSNGIMKEWEMATGQCTVTNTLQWRNHFDDCGVSDSGVFDSRFVSNGQRIVVSVVSHSLASAEIRLYDTSSGNLIRTIPRAFYSAEAVSATSSDGQMLAILHQEPYYGLDIFEASTLTKLAFLDCGPARYASFTEDLTKIASATSRGQISIWNATTGILLQKFSISTSIISIAYSPDGTRLAICGNDSISILDLQFESRLPFSDTRKVEILAVSFSDDGSKLASYSSDGEIRIWDTKSSTCLRSWVCSTDQLSKSPFCFSPNGSVLLTGAPNIAYLWDVLRGDCLLEKSIHSGRRERLWYFPSTIFLNDGRACISELGQGTAVIWDSVSGHELKTLIRAPSPIVEFALSPDGQNVITCHDDCTPKIWNLANGDNLLMLADTNGLITNGRMPYGHHGVIFSADGRYLATAIPELGIVSAWDLQAGTCVLTTIGYPDILTSRAMHTVDGQLLLRYDREEDDPPARYLTVRTNCSWIIRDGFPVIWIPPAYRQEPNTNIAIREDMIAIGSRLGNVLLFKFT